MCPWTKIRSVSVFPQMQDLPDDGSQQKEVYAVAGLALYQAQVWERGMVNLALIMRLAKKKFQTLDDWDKSEDELSSLTAGRLRRTIEEEGLAPTNTLKLWQKTLKSRNALVHGFFYEYAVSFMTPEGRQIMVDELASMIQQFESADQQTKDVIERTIGRWGITKDDIASIGSQLIKDYQASSRPSTSP